MNNPTPKARRPQENPRGTQFGEKLYEVEWINVVGRQTFAQVMAKSPEDAKLIAPSYSRYVAKARLVNP